MRLVQPPPLATPHTEDRRMSIGTRVGSAVFSQPWSDWFAKVVTPKLESTPQFKSGTHNDRTGSQAPIWPLGSLYQETDRNVFYVATGSPEVWIYAFGTMLGLDANKPADLGTNDRGFQYLSTDISKLLIWDGASWVVL